MPRIYINCCFTPGLDSPGLRRQGLWWMVCPLLPLLYRLWILSSTFQAKLQEAGDKPGPNGRRGASWHSSAIGLKNACIAIWRIESTMGLGLIEKDSPVWLGSQSSGSMENWQLQDSDMKSQFIAFQIYCSVMACPFQQPRISRLEERIWIVLYQNGSFPQSQNVASKLHWNSLGDQFKVKFLWKREHLSKKQLVYLASSHPGTSLELCSLGWEGAGLLVHGCLAVEVTTVKDAIYIGDGTGTRIHTRPELQAMVSSD